MFSIASRLRFLNIFVPDAHVLKTHTDMQRIFPRLSSRLFATRATGSDAPQRLINDDLFRLDRVRLISADGVDCGIMSGRDAVQKARQKGLDVMKVGGGASGVIVRLVDFEAYEEARRKKAYQTRKLRRESRKLEKREGVLKQIRLSPSTDTHDMRIKMRQAKEFLMSGYRVRVYMQFRRGQGRLNANAKLALVRAAEDLQEFGKVQGLADGGGIPDLFKEEEGTNETGEPVKKKPLQFWIQPLPRKMREQISKETKD